ncbi:hypothetical protein CRE_22714 [Caenorhabditis remanei]|uniref:Reverse transcriptase domain-containing protein n=1 Tax=Caenorhabditis remanei TaxID=31234 RepID=E3NKF3_CAERE|nr:hypothetical protein CRE_22714 [Caenorhabditis remanei]
MTDHILSVQRLLEVGQGYQIPIAMIFIDFRKVSDAIKPTDLWETLKTQGFKEQEYLAGFDCRNGLLVVENIYKQLYRTFKSGASKNFPYFFIYVLSAAEIVNFRLEFTLKTLLRYSV